MVQHQLVVPGTKKARRFGAGQLVRDFRFAPRLIGEWLISLSDEQEIRVEVIRQAEYQELSGLENWPDGGLSRFARKNTLFIGL